LSISGAGKVFLRFPPRKSSVIVAVFTLIDINPASTEKVAGRNYLGKDYTT
jgi:hypothetical protein